MHGFIPRLLILAALVVAGPASAAPTFPVQPDASPVSPLVRAQGIQIQLGLSDAMILSVMAGNGYTDIEITKKKLTKARAHGCKNGTRFDVEIGFDGRIRKAKRIGNCRPQADPQAVRRILRRKGFANIQVVRQGPGFAAVACRGNRRFRVLLNPFGDITGEKPLGRCGSGLSRHDVAALLRAQGFSRIDVRPGPRGAFTANACRGGDRVELRVGGDGSIRRERRTGRCSPPIHPATIPALLSRMGFTRIDVVDRRLPRYVAHACRGTQRLEIGLDRFGEVTDERAIGNCVPPLDADGLVERLHENGYDQVRVVSDGPGGFVAEVCEDGTRFRLELTRYGETVNQTELGECPSREVGSVLKQLERQGLTGATLYVDGCRRNRRVRIELDRYGHVVDRKVLGRCH